MREVMRELLNVHALLFKRFLEVLFSIRTYLMHAISLGSCDTAYINRLV